MRRLEGGQVGTTVERVDLWRAGGRAWRAGGRPGVAVEGVDPWRTGD